MGVVQLRVLQLGVVQMGVDPVSAVCIQKPPLTHTDTAQYPNTLPDTPRHIAFLSKNKTTAWWRHYHYWGYNVTAYA